MAFSTLTGAIRIDASGVSEGTDEAEEEIDSLTGRMQSAGKQMQSAGAAMTAGITAPLVAMGGMAAKQAASFDQSMQKSIAVMGDVDTAMREDLEATAREVATSTTQSHQQAAESFYYLASAGLTATESMEAMPQVAAFAEAGQMDMAQATDVATNVMSAFGYEAAKMNEVTDTLTATVTSHNQTMNGMADAMSRVAPTAAGMGVEIEEAAAAIGLLGDVGIQGQRAGTSLNRALTVLANPTGRAATKLEQLGVSVRDSSGDLRSLTAIMADFEAAGADSADMAAIFGSEAGPAMASLLQQGSSAIEESTSSLKDAEGATQDVAETQRQTLNAELQVMRSNLEDAGVAIGANLLPMLSALSGHVQRAGQWFAGLSDTQQKVAIATGAVAAAAGPLLVVGGTLLTMLPAMASGFAMVSAASLPVTAPILAIVAAVGLLGAAFATDFMGIRGIASDAIGGVMDNLDLLKFGLQAALGPIGALWLAWENNFLGIQNATADAKDAVLNNLDLVVDGLLAVLGPVGWLVVAYRRNIGGLGDATDEMVDDVVGGIDWLITKITQIPQELQNLIDRIPGVDGEKVADKLFPPKPASEKAEETGEAAAEAAKDGADSGASEADASTKDLLTGGENPYSAGERVGTDLAAGATAGIEEAAAGTIKGTVTEELAAVANETSIADDAEVGEGIAIDQGLFEELLGEMDSLTPSALGITQSQFARLRAGSSSVSAPSGTGASPGASAMADTTTSTSSSSGGTGTRTGGGGSKIAEKLDELISLLAGLTVEGDLDVDDEEFGDAIDGTVRARFESERDRFERMS